MFIHHLSKFGKFSLKIGGEIIFQSWLLLTPFFNLTIVQCVTRSLFQFSRREREFLSFNLMFETGTRISLFQSHVRDGNENFFFSISCFETRTRISFFNLGLRDENENRDWDNSRENFRELHFLLFYWLIFSKKGCVFLKISWNNMSFFLEKFEWKSQFPRREREYFLSISCFETRTGIFFINLVFRDENEK